MVRTLLSIDFDFFFPDEYYDWGHREAPFFIKRELWEIRAADFIRTDKPLPTVDTARLATFLDQVQIKPGAPFYISESHLIIREVIDREQPTHIVNYDAHHDFGYSTGGNDCSDWGLYAASKGATVTLIYPDWRQEYPEEPPNEWSDDPAAIYFDSDYKSSSVFDAVILCRSGAWVPAWTDAEFFRFVKQIKSRYELKPIYAEPKLTRRRFRISAARKHADMMKSIIDSA